MQLDGDRSLGFNIGRPRLLLLSLQHGLFDCFAFLGFVAVFEVYFLLIRLPQQLQFLLFFNEFALVNVAILVQDLVNCVVNV